MCSRACRLRCVFSHSFDLANARPFILHALLETRALQFCLLLVCPHLSGWVSSSYAEPVPLALSSESVYNSGQKIFVLDSFINVCFFLNIANPPSTLTHATDHCLLWHVSRSHAAPCRQQACPVNQTLKNIPSAGAEPLHLIFFTVPLKCDCRCRGFCIFVRVTRARRISFPA